MIEENGADVTDILHLWNAVELDGEWYQADVTWDDLDEDEEIPDEYVTETVTDSQQVLIEGFYVDPSKYPDADLTFMTAHSSKGLGYDNVILINMFEGKFGFPCQIEDDPIIKLVTYEDISVPFAEERRLFYVALTRTKNRVYIATPQNKPSRFLIELVKDYGLAHSDKLNMDVVDLFQLRCPICGYPLKYEFNKNYGLQLWICTNEPEVCDFMTNDKVHKHDIQRCDKCSDGYLIVKMNPKTGDVFYGCTNYFSEKKCKNMITLPKKPI